MRVLVCRSREDARQRLAATLPLVNPAAFTCDVYESEQGALVFAPTAGADELLATLPSGTWTQGSLEGDAVRMDGLEPMTVRSVARGVDVLGLLGVCGERLQSAPADHYDEVILAVGHPSAAGRLVQLLLRWEVESPRVGRGFGPDGYALVVMAQQVPAIVVRQTLDDLSGHVWYRVPREGAASGLYAPWRHALPLVDRLRPRLSGPTVVNADGTTALLDLQALQALEASLAPRLVGTTARARMTPLGEVRFEVPVRLARGATHDPDPADLWLVGEAHFGALAESLRQCESALQKLEGQAVHLGEGGPLALLVRTVRPAYAAGALLPEAEAYRDRGVYHAPAGARLEPALGEATLAKVLGVGDGEAALLRPRPEGLVVLKFRPDAFVPLLESLVAYVFEAESTTLCALQACSEADFGLLADTLPAPLGAPPPVGPAPTGPRPGMWPIGPPPPAARPLGPPPRPPPALPVPPAPAPGGGSPGDLTAAAAVVDASGDFDAAPLWAAVRAEATRMSDHRTASEALVREVLATPPAGVADRIGSACHLGGPALRAHAAKRLLAEGAPGRGRSTRGRATLTLYAHALERQGHLPDSRTRAALRTLVRDLAQGGSPQRRWLLARAVWDLAGDRELVSELRLSIEAAMGSLALSELVAPAVAQVVTDRASRRGREAMRDFADRLGFGDLTRFWLDVATELRFLELEQRSAGRASVLRGRLAALEPNMLAPAMLAARGFLDLLEGVETCPERHPGSCSLAAHLPPGAARSGAVRTLLVAEGMIQATAVIDGAPPRIERLWEASAEPPSARVARWWLQSQGDAVAVRALVRLPQELVVRQEQRAFAELGRRLREPTVEADPHLRCATDAVRIAWALAAGERTRAMYLARAALDALREAEASGGGLDRLEARQAALDLVGAFAAAPAEERGPWVSAFGDELCRHGHLLDATADRPITVRALRLLLGLTRALVRPAGDEPEGVRLRRRSWFEVRALVGADLRAMEGGVSPWRP